MLALVSLKAGLAASAGAVGPEPILQLMAVSRSARWRRFLASAATLLRLSSGLPLLMLLPLLAAAQTRIAMKAGPTNPTGSVREGSAWCVHEGARNGVEVVAGLVLLNVASAPAPACAQYRPL